MKDDLIKLVEKVLNEIEADKLVDERNIEYIKRFFNF